VIPAPGGLARRVAVLLVLSASAAAAQEVVPDSTRAAPDTTHRAPPPPPPVIGAIPPAEIAPGPLAPGSRITFSRDSILWTSSYTLADLLSEVPGVTAARTGYAGEPTPVLYGGRGTAGIEIFYDGVPLTALGVDSISVDPGRISLIGLRRVEVERHPAFLRVYLVSERDARLGARSYLRILNGDFRTAGYAGVFQYRWPSGVGLDMSADYLNTKGGQGDTRNARWFDLRARSDWTPSPLLSASFQLAVQTQDREATLVDNGLSTPLRKDRRTETLLRIQGSTRPNRFGVSYEAGLQSTNWSADSATADTVLGRRMVNRVFAGLRVSNGLASAGVTVRASDYHTPLDVELTTGWTPLPWVVVAAGARRETHTFDRKSSSAWGSLGLYAGPLSLVGDARWADAVAAPVLATDTAQRTLDLGGRLGLATRKLTVHGGLERRDGFTPPPITEIAGLPPLPPTPPATFFVGDASIQYGSLTLSGTLAQPIAGKAPAFEPPMHSRVALTFRSKFIRTFRSGAFDLKVQVAVESWGAGTAGVDAEGAPVSLPGASVADAYLQVELAHFHAFYSLKNFLRATDTWVPGFEYPRNRQTFGVKWLFRN